LRSFDAVYWIAMILEILIRAPYQKTWKEGEKSVQRDSIVEKMLLGLLALFMFVLPLVYFITPWLNFANYRLPDWLGWTGIVLIICSLLVFWRSHYDLKSNWSPTLEIRKNHTLITTGIFAYIRHPMYASQWLWVIAQALLLQNWLAGSANLLFFIVFYIIRVRGEEKMMIDTFGKKYLDYKANVGAIIPRNIGKPR
jgi:protein-S-isoprenylcysteine O-methyltransferase Ste14